MNPKRLLNSNDIFNQIGLILEHSEHNNLADKKMRNSRNK